MLVFTVERKGEKHVKFEGNIVRVFDIVFSVKDKNVLSYRQMGRASKKSLPDLLPNTTGCVGRGMHAVGPTRAVSCFTCRVQCSTLDLQDFSLRCAMQGLLAGFFFEW